MFYHLCAYPLLLHLAGFVRGGTTTTNNNDNNNNNNDTNTNTKTKTNSTTTTTNNNNNSNNNNNDNMFTLYEELTRLAETRLAQNSLGQSKPY